MFCTSEVGKDCAFYGDIKKRKPVNKEVAHLNGLYVFVSINV